MEVVIPTLVIRADSTAQIGTGHIMRCIALAQAWQDQGGKVTFITHCESEKLRERIIKEGFELILVDHTHPHPSDLEQTLAIILKLINRTNKTNKTNKTNEINQTNSTSNPWLVLDGYHFTSDYQKAIKDAGIRLLVIDDMNHLPHYYADIILNQNIHAKDLKYNCSPDTKLLLGTEYVLLRREFLKYKDFKREIPEKARRILVTMGGADPDNVTLKVIQALNLLNDPDLEVKVVVGPSNPHIDSLREAVPRPPFSVHLLQSVDDMPFLMAWADMAISAAGSTVWELGFFGLPIVAMTLAKNQYPIVKYLETRRAVLNLGWHNEISQNDIVRVFTILIKNHNLRAEIGENLKRLVAGNGCERVLNQIIANRIKLRPVNENDCELIWLWANDEDTRKASFSEHFISWDEHLTWFQKKLKEQNHLFFIATNNDGKPIGQIRFSIVEDIATVSFSIAPGYRNLGYGVAVLRSSTIKIFHDTGIRQILAYVKKENTLSIKTFQKALFKNMGEISIRGKKAYMLVLERKELDGKNNVL